MKRYLHEVEVWSKAGLIQTDTVKADELLRYGKVPRLRYEVRPSKLNPPEVMLGVNQVEAKFAQPVQPLISSVTVFEGNVQAEMGEPAGIGVGVGEGRAVGVGVGGIDVGVGWAVGVGVGGTGVGVEVGPGVGVGGIGLGVGVGTPGFRNQGVAVVSDLKNSMSMSATAWFPSAVGWTQSVMRWVMGQIRPSDRGFSPSIQRYGPQARYETASKDLSGRPSIWPAIKLRIPKPFSKAAGSATAAAT